MLHSSGRLDALGSHPQMRASWHRYKEGGRKEGQSHQIHLELHGTGLSSAHDQSGERKGSLAVGFERSGSWPFGTATLFSLQSFWVQRFQEAQCMCWLQHRRLPNRLQACSGQPAIPG